MLDCSRTATADVNYRHEFHAGNFADVHKHVVLLALIERLQRKPKPLFYLETHAGRGWYDLTSPDATRGNEWTNGVARLEGFIAGWGLDDVLRRAEAYHAAGADALLVHSRRKTPDEILAFARAWGRRSPVVIVPTTYYSTPVDVFEKAGIDLGNKRRMLRNDSIGHFKGNFRHRLGDALQVDLVLVGIASFFQGWQQSLQFPCTPKGTPDDGPREIDVHGCSRPSLLLMPIHSFRHF